MTTLHVTNSYNVKATISDTLSAALKAITGLPPFMVTPSVVFNWPEIAASTPCFSFAHFTGSSSDHYQGRGDGAGNSAMRNTGLLEISAWVSRDEKDSNGMDVWAARLEYMGGMVQHVIARNPVIRLADYTTNPSLPASAGYKVNMGDLNEVQVAADENPAIKRKRFLVSYFWDLRA